MILSTGLNHDHNSSILHIFELIMSNKKQLIFLKGRIFKATLFLLILLQKSHQFYLFIEIINNNRMLVVRFLLSYLVVVSWAANDFPFCSRSFSPKEWQKEGQSYLLNIREFEQHLQPEPYLLSKILLLATGHPQSFLELAGTAVQKVVPLNKTYLLACVLLSCLMLAFYFLRKKHQFSQIPFFSLMLVEKAKKTRHLKYCIIFLLVIAAALCIRGIGEGSRQEKAINHILCQILSTKKFIQKNSTYIGHAEMFDYVYQLSQKLNGDNFKETRNLQMKLRLSEYPQQCIEQIARILSSQAYKGSKLQQLQSASKTLGFLSNFMIVSNVFEQKCRQRMLSFLLELLKYTEIFQTFSGMTNNQIKDVKLDKFAESAAIFGKICFSMVLLVAIITGVVILRKEEKQNTQLILDWLSFAIFVIVILCFVTVIVETLFLTFNFWAKQQGKQLINDPNLCYDQFSVIPTPVGLCRVLSPTSKDQKYRKFSPFTSEMCHTSYDQFNTMVRPYLDQNETYFYDLMVDSVQEIRDQAIKGELMKKIQNKKAKVSLVPIMKDMQAHLAFFLKMEDEIQQQNINFTEFFQEIMNVFATSASNSAYAIRQICQTLSIILCLLLFALNIIKWLIHFDNNTKLSAQGNSLTELTDIEPDIYNS